MALFCTNSPNLDVVAQQLFLGSSIMSFSSNTGWGGNKGTLNVDLVDDYGCFRLGEISSNPGQDVFVVGTGNADLTSYDADNHYYNCSGNDCFIDENGNTYDAERPPVGQNGLPPEYPPSKIKIVPGKVYHYIGPSGLVQKYWRKHDPGFFGNATRINPNGGALDTQNVYRYNIIGAPVYFRFGYYTFGGFVSRWECNNRVGTPTYSVEIESADSLLKNCKVILSKFGGSIFSSFSTGTTQNPFGTSVGGPSNYYGPDADHFDRYALGNLPNVFNVYGFLESYGFGTANYNDQGMPLAYILNALSVLTSADTFSGNTVNFNRWFTGFDSSGSTSKLGPHYAFSPYARIIAPSLMTDGPNPINANLGIDGNDHGFGIMPPSVDAAGIPRVEFLLDLSEVPKPPLDVRYSGANGVCSITDLIQYACEKTGKDFYTTIIRKDGLNFIKIKVVDRTIALPSNTIESVVRTLENSNVRVSQSSFGKTKNEAATPRVMYIGDNQQRLYQTKSYILGYTNTHLVYHPILRKFVDYYKFGKATRTEIETFDAKTGKKGKAVFVTPTSKKWSDSFKVPVAYSTRNLNICSAINTPFITRLFSNEQLMYGNGTDPFANGDSNFSDSPVSGSYVPRLGNYWPTIVMKLRANTAAKKTDTSRRRFVCESGDNNVDASNPRFIPLWLNSISPFFGYVYDQQLNFTETGRQSNIYRFIRPVYLDTWTGMLVIGFRPNEMPPISLGILPNLYATRFKGVSALSLSENGIQANGAPGGGDKAANEQKNEFDFDVDTDYAVATEDKVPQPFEYNDPRNGLTRIGFTVTESELRAAAAGWESYLEYCLRKFSFSTPDLFRQLVAVYRSNGDLFTTGKIGDSGQPLAGPMQGQGAPGGGNNAAGKNDVDQAQLVPPGAIDILGSNWNWVLNYRFIKDLKIMVEFLQSIHNNFYGKKYIVSLPQLSVYRDLQYQDIQIPLGGLYEYNPTGLSFIQIQAVFNFIQTLGTNKPSDIANYLSERFGINVPIPFIKAVMNYIGIDIDKSPGERDAQSDFIRNYIRQWREGNRDILGSGSETFQVVDRTNNVVVYQGSGKLYFSYELAPDGAWEEPGNMIDDFILVGGPAYFKFCQEDGRIKPILGYNSNVNKDYIAEAWCNLDTPSRNERWVKTTGMAKSLAEKLAEAEADQDNDKAAYLRIKLRYVKQQINKLGRYLNDCSQLTVPSLDLSSIDADSDYVSINVPDAGREDAFGNRVTGKQLTINLAPGQPDPNAPHPVQQQTTVTNRQYVGGDASWDSTGSTPPSDPGGYVTSQEAVTGYYISEDRRIKPIPTTKIYFPTEYEGDILFLDPLTLRGPKALLTAPGVNLFFTSLSYQEDPNDTIINNATSEDLAILKYMEKRANTDSEAEGMIKFLVRSVLSMPHAFFAGQSVETVDQLGQLLDEILNGDGAAPGGQGEGPNNACGKILKIIYQLMETKLIGIKSNAPDNEGEEPTTQTVSPNLDDFFHQDTKVNVTIKHRKMQKRKAHPFFAALPLKDNTSVYGPWTNYPILADLRVYPGVVNRTQIIEQLINNVDVKIEPDFAPWNYGGMAFLDREIVNQINSSATYQLVIEDGTVVTYGMPLFTLSAGLQLRTTESDVHEKYLNNYMGYSYSNLVQYGAGWYAGLALSQIQVSVNDRNISTTYRFSSYNPKLGLFSKENSDRNKMIARSRIELASKLGTVAKKIENKLTSQIAQMFKNRGISNKEEMSKGPSTIYAESPAQILIGRASYFRPTAGLPISSDQGLLPDPSGYAGLFLNSFAGPKEYSAWARQITRTTNWIGTFTEREAMTELTYNFDSKAAMSFDGIFSPVSFFPSENLGTYSISSRYLTPELIANGITCPFCLGSGTYEYYPPYFADAEAVTYPCPLCNKPKLSFNNVYSPEFDDSPDIAPEINLISLNPIVVPYGEFANPNSQVSLHPYERSRHSIRIISRQEGQQTRDSSFDITNNLGLVSDRENYSQLDYIEDLGAAGVPSQLAMTNPDYDIIDHEFEDPVSNRQILLNQRFFAFRGPMMLHGWGYDTDGYPIPNQADEPYDFDDNGLPLRFRLTTSGTNDYESEGAYLPTSDYRLGDIIGSGWTMDGGQWTRKPTRFFHLNWAERSDLWPVGPIDLRWDRERKVWTAGGCGEIDPPYIVASGNNNTILSKFLTKSASSSNKKCPYKLVYVVLEEDLIKVDGLDETYPARGFLDDAEYSTVPLPSNTRKLIYIKDRCGYTAPRGAKLLCRYDRDTKFYEPITKQQYIVFGSITGGNNAIIDLTYIQGIKSAEHVPKINIIFDNTRFNFGLNNKNKGMFMYENGSWILIGTN